MRQLWRIRPCLDQSTAEILVHAFITSRLDYCNCVFAGCAKHILDRLQVIQNAAARLVVCAKKRDSISPLFQKLHWLKVQERIKFKLALITYKCQHNLAPSYLSNNIVPLSCNTLRSTRSSTNNNLVVPRSYTVTYGNKPFCIAGPTTFNNLPNSVKNSTSIDEFKSRLKTFLFR